LSSSNGTAKLLFEASLSRAAFRKSRRFKKRISLVVVYGPVDWLFASKKDPFAEKGSDILAFKMLGFSFTLGSIDCAVTPKF